MISLCILYIYLSLFAFVSDSHIERRRQGRRDSVNVVMIYYPSVQLCPVKHSCISYISTLHSGFVLWQGLTHKSTAIIHRSLFIDLSSPYFLKVKPKLHYYFASSFFFNSVSISSTISLGFVFGPYLLYGFPSLSTKNFAKFQRMSVVPSSFGSVCFRNE